MKHEHVMTIMAIIISDLLLPMAQFPLDFLVLPDVMLAKTKLPGHA
jgi:integral membrane sensor domain MASE1